MRWDLAILIGLLSLAVLVYGSRCVKAAYAEAGKPARRVGLSVLAVLLVGGGISMIRNPGEAFAVPLVLLGATVWSTISMWAWNRFMPTGKSRRDQRLRLPALRRGRSS